VKVFVGSETCLKDEMRVFRTDKRGISHTGDACRINSFVSSDVRMRTVLSFEIPTSNHSLAFMSLCSSFLLYHSVRFIIAALIPKLKLSCILLFFCNTSPSHIECTSVDLHMRLSLMHVTNVPPMRESPDRYSGGRTQVKGPVLYPWGEP
jgi:hypothetical protein